MGVTLIISHMLTTTSGMCTQCWKLPQKKGSGEEKKGSGEENFYTSLPLLNFARISRQQVERSSTAPGPLFHNMKLWRNSGSEPLVQQLTGTKPVWSDWIIWEAFADASCKCILTGLGMDVKQLSNSKKIQNDMQERNSFQVFSLFFAG